MSNINSFLNKSEYIDPSDINQGLKNDPKIGKTLCELVVELVGIERDKVLAGGDSVQYNKVLMPLFNKFGKNAPTTQIQGDAFEEVDIEELEHIYNNLLTRKILLDESIEQKRNKGM